MTAPAVDAVFGGYTSETFERLLASGTKADGEPAVAMRAVVVPSLDAAKRAAIYRYLLDAMLPAQ